MRISSASIPLRILLIEDSRGDAFLIDRAFQQAMPDAYTLQHVSTLAAAMHLLTTREFDIAILDRSLPDVVGYNSLQSIQNMAPKLPIVFLTAYRDEAMALEAIEQGAQDYLFKDKMDGHTIRRSLQFAIIRKQFESVLVVQANYDHLTGLANRMLFENRVEMALARINRQGGGVGLLFLDLNRFKQVNDVYGHAVGDKLLSEVGQRLKRCLRSYDTAARLSGDEFAILVEGITQDDPCVLIAQKIIKSCEEPFVSSNRMITVGASIGITSCIAGQSINWQELMRQADAAMYDAKTLGQSAYRVWKTLPLHRQSVA